MPRLPARAAPADGAPALTAIAAAAAIRRGDIAAADYLVLRARRQAQRPERLASGIAMEKAFGPLPPPKL